MIFCRSSVPWDECYNTISTERCQTLFENILKNFFERIYVVFDKGAAAGTQPAAAPFRVKSRPETIVESAIRLQNLKSALQLLLQRQINIPSASV